MVLNVCVFVCAVHVTVMRKSVISMLKLLLCVLWILSLSWGIPVSMNSCMLYCLASVVS